MDILRNRSLLIIGAAESVSGAGNWITMLAVFAIVVFRGDGGVTQSSGIFLAGLLPTLLASPLAGRLCDRYDRKRLMIASELLDGLVVAGLIFARRLELIYALLALQAVVMSIMAPARQSVVPALVPEEALTQANALLQQLASLIKIGAPMLAGLVLALLDPHTAIILDVVSFALSALILTRLPALPPPGRPDVQAAGTKGDAARGSKIPGAAGRPAGGTAPARGALGALRSSAPLRVLFAAMFLGVAVIVGFDVLSSVVVRDVLVGNETLFGLLVGLVGAGSAAAAALLIARGKGRDAWRDLALGVALLALLPAGLAAAAVAAGQGAPALARLIAAGSALVGGVGNGLLGIQIGTLLQRCSPPALLGRLGGLFQSTIVAGQLLGIIVTPLLVPGRLSIGRYFSLAAVALGLVALYVAYTQRRLPQPARA